MHHPRTRHIHGDDDEMATSIVAKLSTMRAVKVYLILTVLYCIGNEVLISLDRYPFQFYTFLVSVLAIVFTLLVLVATDLQDRKNRRRDDLQAQEVAELHEMNRRQLVMLELLLRHIADDEQPN